MLRPFGTRNRRSAFSHLAVQIAVWALAVAALAPVVSAQASPTASQPPSEYVISAGETVVHTDAGKLMGARYEGVYDFRGVQYAQAERFMPPEPVTPWDGIKPAVHYGQNCPVPPMTSVANGELFNPHRYLPESEDCLFLNVWTPGINDGVDRPVMVWIHGGGFTNGSGIEQVAYDGHNLSKRGDVVVISLNHRLNVLGFLDLSAYGPAYRYSGNVGIMDLVAALQWVHDNVAAFGGDPDNVTIFGQSGGGAKVAALMGNPAAEGLFEKGIVESGVWGTLFADQASAQLVAKYTLQNLGLTGDQVDRLQAVSYGELLAAGTKALTQVADAGAGSARWTPVLDGDYFPVIPIGDAWAPQAKDIPLLIGNVLNEFQTIITNEPGDLFADNKDDWSDKKARAMLAKRFGDRADAVAKAFLAAYPSKTLADAYFLDTLFRPGTILWADAKARQGGAPVYSYMFTKESPVMGGIAMAYHCSELPYVFDNVGLVPQATGGDAAAFALADKVSSAWVNFARTGNPSAKGLPDWPAYTVGDQGDDDPGRCQPRCRRS